MTQCLSSRPAAQAWPPADEWIMQFLHAGGDHWDREAAIALTSEALSGALAHGDRPVRLTAHRDGTAAWVSISAPMSTLPKTEWTAGHPLVEEVLPRLRQRTPHGGAEARITPDGSQIMIWFTLPPTASASSRDPRRDRGTDRGRTPAAAGRGDTK